MLFNFVSHLKTSGILFSISVTFALKLILITRPAVTGILFSVSVIFVL